MSRTRGYPVFSLGENRVADAIIRQLQNHWRHGSKGFMAFNCPMCIERGEKSADKRHRGGVLIEGDAVGVFCFNCGFRTKHVLGNPLGVNIKRFMDRIGVPRIDVLRLEHWALAHARAKDLPETSEDDSARAPKKMPEISLPKHARSLGAWAEDGCDDPDFIEAVTYLMSRGDGVSNSCEFYWSPLTDNHLNQRFIIPCYLGGKIVGWTARAVGEILRPKYIKEWPEDFLFNADALSKEGRDTVIIAEGVLDALVVDGVGAGSATLNAQQIAWINSSPKQKILLPDRDRAGDKLIEIAIANQWSVSFPGTGKSTWWEPDVKDAAKASERYGRLWTLRSIIASATSNAASIRTLMGLSHR